MNATLTISHDGNLAPLGRWHGQLALLVACLACIAFGLVGPNVTTANAAAPSLRADEAQVLRLVNAYRASYGLERLVADTRLQRAARWMSADQAKYAYFSHTDRFGRDPFKRLSSFGYARDTWRGENLAAGHQDAASTLKQWIDSPGHRANLLGSRYRAVGIARVYSATSPYGYYWSMELGSRVMERATVAL